MRDNNKKAFSNVLQSDDILNTNKIQNIKNSKNLIINTNYIDMNLCSSSISKSIELDNVELREKVFSNPKFVYNISIFLPIESVIKFMLVNREYYYRISNNKVFIDALEIKHNKTTGEIIYLKEYDWLNKRKPQLSEISAEVECTINSQKQILNLLNKIWIYLFFIVIVNVFFYLIAMLKEKILTITQEEDYWKLILPLSIFWAFTLIILIVILIVKLYYNFKLREILTIKLREYKIFSSLRMEYLFKEYKMKYRNKITSIFTKYLIAYILFWIPFLINYNIMPQSKFESNELFSLGGMIFLGVFYLKELFSFLKAKIYYFTDSKISKYKEIVKNSNKDFLIEKLDNEVMQFQKSKIYLSETTLTMLFFIVKFIIFVGLIFYFDKIGSKIETPSKVSTSWVVFFIPFYFFMLVLGIYVVLKAFAEENDTWAIVKHTTSSFVYYTAFLTSSILFPLKLENNLTGMNSFVIPALNTFGSVYLLIHKTCFYNKK